MLKSLDIANFTVFSKATFDFSPQLNIFAGDNGTGKSHLLKIAYALIAASAEAGKKPNAPQPTKTYLQKAYAEKLLGVFRPDTLGRLARRFQGRERCELALFFDDQDLDSAISFATNAKTDVQIEHLQNTWQQSAPLFFPTRELLTISPGFAALYESHYLNFLETWRDTCLHLGAPAVRGARETQSRSLLEPIEQAMGGRVVLEKDGQSYLKVAGQGKMEMSLVAEGLRKLAMLARLIVTGALLDKGYLFWDEPEANLNPRLIRLVAKSIHELSKEGVQVFLSTHSFFLLKELDLLNRKDPIQQRYFGLALNPDGNTFQTADRLSGLENIASLDEEIEQYDRELELG